MKTTDEIEQLARNWFREMHNLSGRVGHFSQLEQDIEYARLKFRGAIQELIDAVKQEQVDNR